MSDKTTVAQAIKMISDQDMCHWSDAHDRVTLAALREYDWSTPSALPVAQDALDRVREALPEFSQQDDYLLAHGASLMSEDSHEIIHVDTIARIVAAIVGTPSKEGAGQVEAVTDEQIIAANEQGDPDGGNPIVCDTNENIVRLARAVLSLSPSRGEAATIVCNACFKTGACIGTCRAAPIGLNGQGDSK